MHINTVETTRVAAVGEGNQAAVTLRGLTKRYGPHTVLDGIDLSIAPGEFVALVGRSGCGKSTLLRLIAGLEASDGGTVAIDGAGRADALRLMFQEARLLPWKSVLGNVALGGIGHGSALAALEQVGLATRAGNGRRCFLVGNGSAWPWRGRWSMRRESCCSTNRWAPSMP
jgi:sulfonate transport system ATP-binding protein